MDGNGASKHLNFFFSTKMSEIVHLAPFALSSPKQLFHLNQLKNFYFLKKYYFE